MQITEYVSIEKQLLLDSQKYIERAQIYLSEDKLGHCIGCLAKAAKKIKKSEEFKLSMDSLNYSLMQPMVVQMLKQIEDRIVKCKINT